MGPKHEKLIKPLEPLKRIRETYDWHIQCKEKAITLDQFMQDNGLGEKDMVNDITLQHEI